MKAETRTPFPDTFVREYLKTGKMKEIQLTQDKVTLVDDEDYDYLMQQKWYAIKRHEKNIITWYAVFQSHIGGRCKQIFMHRFIMNTPNNMQVDHIDHNGLNNQKFNLRNCNRSQNGKNRTAYGRSEYLGVTITKNNSIHAHIRIGGKQTYLGIFKLESEAAIAYDIAAIKYHKEFANTNFKYSKWFIDYLCKIK